MKLLYTATVMPRPWFLFALLLLGVCLLPPRAGHAQAPTSEAKLVPPAALSEPDRIDDLLRRAHDLEGSDTALALQKAREALAAARRASLRPQELQALLQTGRAWRLLNDYPDALRSAEDGMSLAKTLGNIHTLGELFLLRGFVEWNQSKVPEATVSMMEAYRLGDTSGDKALQVGGLYGRGIVRGRSDDLDGALDSLQAALQLAEQTGDDRLGPILNSMAVIYLQRKDYPRAKETLDRALAILKDSTNRRTFAYAVLNLGQVATETGDQDAAGRYLDASLAICEQFHFRRGIADIAYLQGARQRRLGHLDAAIQSLDRALELAGTLGNPDLFVSIYEEYVQTEQQRGNYKAALDYTRQLADKMEIVRGEKSRRQSAEIQARYEIEHHTREIKTLQRAHDLQQADLAIKDAQLGSVRWLLFSLVMGGITLAALASRQRAHVRLAERMLAQTRAAKTAVEIEDAHKAELLAAVSHELRESEARFRSAFEYSALGLALVGLDGRWLRVNQALCKIVGYTEAELLARDFQSITHPDDLDADLVLAARLMAHEIDTYSLEKRYLHRAGHVVWIRLDATLLSDPVTNAPNHFISQIHDITERRRDQERLRAAKEEAEEANEAKNAFLSRMSHELRTPLNAILGFGQLLETEDLGERQNQSVAHITGAGRHLLDLINEILDIAQIESGQFTFNPEPILAIDLLGSAVCLLEPLAGEAGVALHLESPGEADAPMYILADPRRLRQIVLNLLANAIKYNRPGGEVRVRAVARAGRLRMEVADNGVGIAPENLERIFAPFTRLAATENVHGTGLGLSVSKALTKVMHGTLDVTSEPGRGSTFALEFSLLSAEEAAQEPLPLLEGIPPEFFAPPLRDSTVLYIEDHVDNRQLVRHILAMMPGMRMVEAETGEAGLAAARTDPPDLILLDLNLPDMTGVEVLRRLRAHHQLSNVPVIIMSADASMSQLDTLRPLGMYDYLTTPFELKQFRQVVENAVSARAMA